MGQDLANHVILLAGLGGKIAGKFAHIAILLVCTMGEGRILKSCILAALEPHLRHLNHVRHLQVVQVVQAVQDCKISRLQSRPPTTPPFQQYWSKIDKIVP